VTGQTLTLRAPAGPEWHALLRHPGWVMDDGPALDVLLGR
jgi:hypothetical protein